MDTYLIIDGNTVYEIDQECAKQKNLTFAERRSYSYKNEQSQAGEISGRNSRPKR